MIFVANDKGTHSHLHYPCSAPGDGVWDRYCGPSNNRAHLQAPALLELSEVPDSPDCNQQSQTKTTTQDDVRIHLNPLEISLPR
jgi:hypothetical protein